MATNNKVTTAAAWKKAALHQDILCPSGVRVAVKIPDLPKMIESGQMPQHLLDAASSINTGENQMTPEMAKQEREFNDFMVKATVVEPELTDADLSDIPYEDKAFLVSIATRQRDVDAEGEHIAGLTSSAKFRRFRKLGEFDADLAGL